MHGTRATIFDIFSKPSRPALWVRRCFVKILSRCCGIFSLDAGICLLIYWVTKALIIPLYARPTKSGIGAASWVSGSGNTRCAQLHSLLTDSKHLAVVRSKEQGARRKEVALRMTYVRLARQAD